MAGVLPGGTIRRGRFLDAIHAIKKKHEFRIRDILDDIGNETVAHLQAITPKDTGAAAGTTLGAKRVMYKWHPAFKMGLPIGNEPGDSGWQMTHTKNSNKFAIINPMWDPYLKYVNYGHGDNNNFVETAAAQMRESLREMR